MADAIRADLDEVLRVGGSDSFHIAVQYDGPQGAERHLVTSPLSNPQESAKALGRVDSGSPEALLDFLHWGMSVCKADQIALVFGSPTAKGFQSDAASDPDNDRVFALSHDCGSGHYLDATDLGWVIRAALEESNRDRLDLFAIDSCEVQYLELAHELEDIVGVLIAPQTDVPASGWDYQRVLGKWKSLAEQGERLDSSALAQALLGEISACYQQEMPSSVVSALDLRRLDDVARAFDTLCIGTLQSLGEGLIWDSREVLLRSINRQANAPVYDCGSFFSIWGVCLEAMADEATQGWLGTTLSRTEGARLDRFFETVARQLEGRDDAPDTSHAPESRRDLPDAARLDLLIETLRSPPKARKNNAKRFLVTVYKVVRRRIKSERPSADGDDASRLPSTESASSTDRLLSKAIKAALHLLPQERRLDLLRMEESRRSAELLAAQAEAALRALLGDENGAGGMVIAALPAEATWPRWSGVSVYRPDKLDKLMSAGYQRFTFHRRVHWAAMLGAANLIEQHPRALWRMISSLLGTGASSTRRDVLRRLTGTDSIVWGLREQFRIMAPAPTLTLSLERAEREYGASQGNGNNNKSNGNGSATRAHYLLRLESITRGAVITEQRSRVQPRVMDSALAELEVLLKRDTLDSSAFAALRSIGGQLGEDIFQALGHVLEEEREAALDDDPDSTPHLQLQIPRELMRYPWELLHRSGHWLGERYAMGRQVYMETGLARRVAGRRQGRVRPLVIGDPVFDADQEWRQLPGARAEAEQIAGWFERVCAETGSVIDFDRRRDTRIHCRVTCGEMRALLRAGEYDIVHFAGHGVFRSDDPETSAWLMSDGELWSLEIRNTLAEQVAPPWLIFANACEAGMDAAQPRTYQGNVFGLASAFINQGVAAYIAPLWPIDDLLAQHIALEFYRQLLHERRTLGESLRRAKASARRVAYGGRDSGEGGQDSGGQDVLWDGLGWASLVLYGDPTAELFQALAGGPTTQVETEARQAAGAYDALYRRHRPRLPSSAGPDKSIKEPRPNGEVRPPAAAYLHAPDHVMAAWVQGPNWHAMNGSGQRAGQTRPDGELALELVEDGGLRRWRVQEGEVADGKRGGNGAAAPLPNSQISALLADERVRRMLPSNRGLVRVIGRWVISGFADGVNGLVREYDRDQVKNQRLLVVRGASANQLLAATRDAIAAPTPSRPRRALLIIHGTFSETAAPVTGFGPEFVRWAQERYSVVLGFDHWTLSETPEENAKQLAEQLRALDPALLEAGALDLICHSRGGLVARAFCDLLDHSSAVRNIIFIGTPNCGTDLANPRNWATFADLLVNMTGLPGAELYGRMAGLLAQLAARRILNGVPGLLAQSPESVGDPQSLLARLQSAKVDRSKARYGVVCAEFEPATLVPNLRKLINAAKAAGVDIVADTLFGDANDLVVNTRHAWGIGAVSPEKESLPKFLQPSRVLIYRPPESNLSLPQGVVAEVGLGVHHCNLFGQGRVQESIKSWLTEA